MLNSERYSPQIILKEIGKDQNKLSKSTVAVIGLGALGTYSSELLVRSGIGEIILIDRDYIELSNLQRQTLFTENDLDLPKVIAAKKHLEKINSELRIEAHVEDFNYKNAEELVSDADIIIDGTDNLETRFLINDLSVKNRIPWIYGAVVGTEGMSFNIIPSKPCFRCIISDLPKIGSLDTCETRGILNTLPPLIAGRQVTEAIKILLNKDYSDKFFRVDLWNNKFELLNVKKSEDCVCCKRKNFEFLNGVRGTFATRMCGMNTFQIRLTKEIESFERLSKKLESVGKVSFNEFILHFSVNNKKLSLFKDGRIIVKGVRNEKEAKTYVSKYIG